jgi:hypothetical protein
MDGNDLSQYVPVFQTLIWAIVVIVVIAILRKEFKDFIKRVTGSDEIEISLGALSIQANTMREFQRSLDIGFSEGQVMRKEIEALIETKIKSIQSAMEYTIAKTDTRENPREELNEEIIIKFEDGREVTGTALDISDAGIGFKSNGLIRFNEVVEIVTANPQKSLSNKKLSHMRIVRINQVKGSYYYGAEEWTAKSSTF